MSSSTVKLFFIYWQVMDKLFVVSEDYWVKFISDEPENVYNNNEYNTPQTPDATRGCMYKLTICFQPKLFFFFLFCFFSLTHSHMHTHACSHTGRYVFKFDTFYWCSCLDPFCVIQSEKKSEVHSAVKVKHSPCLFNDVHDISLRCHQLCEICTLCHMYPVSQF